MTDITDQDRRMALAWAEGSMARGGADSAARVILATVDAPALTLAEELRGIREWVDWEACSGFDEIVARAEKIEQERDEARAEVDRLTAELNTHSETHSHTETHSVNEVTDPADVKPGEAWLVEVEGERRNAVKGRADGEPWNTFTADGWYLSEDNERITLVSRLVPAPRVITNPDELDRAKRRTVIQDTDGIVCERALLGDGWFVPGIRIDQTPCIKLPVMVLWEPEA